jgi:hypothetical protein
MHLKKEHDCKPRRKRNLPSVTSSEFYCKFSSIFKFYCKRKRSRKKKTAPDLKLNCPIDSFQIHSQKTLTEERKPIKKETNAVASHACSIVI